MKKLEQDTDPGPEKTTIQEILEPINDFYKVKNYLKISPTESPIKTSLRNAIAVNNNCQFVKGKDLVPCNTTKDLIIQDRATFFHAKIKIAQYLSKENSEDIVSRIDFGISKLSCAGCYSLIQAFESEEKIKFNIFLVHMLNHSDTVKI
ncbi:MAG: hypothetical protein ISN64_00605 [Rickettsia sp.]|nr:hypothetical protein [Rickettsia sp.]